MPYPGALPVRLVAVELRDERRVGVRGGQPTAVVGLGGDRLPHRQALLVVFVGGQVEARYEPVPGHRLHRRPPTGIGEEAVLGEALRHRLTQPLGVGVRVGGHHRAPPPFVLVLRMSANASVIRWASGNQPHWPLGLHSMNIQSSAASPSPVRAKPEQPKARPNAAK